MNLSGPELEPVSPTLAGRFSTTEPQGKPSFPPLTCSTDNCSWTCMEGWINMRLFCRHGWLVVFLETTVMSRIAECKHSTVSRIQRWLPDYTLSSLKDFLSDQCREIKENNRIGKTRYLFKKIRDTKGIFLAKIGPIKNGNVMDLAESENIRKR